MLTAECLKGSWEREYKNNTVAFILNQMLQSQYMLAMTKPYISTTYTNKNMITRVPTSDAQGGIITNRTNTSPIQGQVLNTRNINIYPSKKEVLYLHDYSNAFSSDIAMISSILATANAAMEREIDSTFIARCQARGLVYEDYQDLNKELLDDLNSQFIGNQSNQGVKIYLFLPHTFKYKWDAIFHTNSSDYQGNKLNLSKDTIDNVLNSYNGITPVFLPEGKTTLVSSSEPNNFNNSSESYYFKPFTNEAGEKYHRCFAIAVGPRGGAVSMAYQVERGLRYNKSTVNDEYLTYGSWDQRVVQFKANIMIDIKIDSNASQKKLKEIGREYDESKDQPITGHDDITAFLHGNDKVKLRTDEAGIKDLEERKKHHSTSREKDMDQRKDEKVVIKPKAKGNQHPVSEKMSEAANNKKGDKK